MQYDANTTIVSVTAGFLGGPVQVPRKDRETMIEPGPGARIHTISGMAGTLKHEHLPDSLKPLVL